MWLCVEYFQFLYSFGGFWNFIWIFVTLTMRFSERASSIDWSPVMLVVGVRVGQCPRRRTSSRRGWWCHPLGLERRRPERRLDHRCRRRQRSVNGRATCSALGWRRERVCASIAWDCYPRWAPTRTMVVGQPWVMAAERQSLLGVLGSDEHSTAADRWQGSGSQKQEKCRQN